MKRKNIVALIKLTIGVLILFALLKFIGLSELWTVLRTINAWWLIPVFIIYLPVQLMSSLNYYVFLKALGKDVSLWYLFRSITLSNSIGNVSPGKVGEFSMIFFLKNQGVNYGEGFAITVFDKIITFVVLSLIATIGSYIYFDIRLFIKLAIISIGITAIMIFFILVKGIRDFIKKYILKDKSKYFEGFSNTMFLLIRKRKKYILFNLINTTIKWMIDVSRAWMLFRAFGYPIQYILALFVSALVMILSLIPVSLSGLGIKESSGTYIYSNLTDVNPAIAANVMIIGTLRMLLLSFIFYLVNMRILEKNLKFNKLRD